MRNAWPCTVRKMANTSCVDSEIFYQKLGEVKASKKPKPSKITPFIEDNVYNDAVTWLETRNEDSKDRRNLTSQDVAIIKRNGWKLEGGKILSKNGKEYCAQRKRQDGQVYQAKLRISSIPRSNTTLCVTLLDTQRSKVDHQQAKTACASPYSSKRIPNTFANGPNGS